MRLAQFKRNSEEIAKLNAMDTGATFDLNEFSDWTAEEYQQLLGARDIELSEPHHIHAFDENNIPNGGIDWRTQGKVNAVKNQGSCGSCWAFSAVSSAESIHAIKTGQLARLSEQEVVDCSHSGNQGCNGGMYDRAWSDIQKLGGFMSESSYPYTGRQGTCRFNKANVQASPTGYRLIQANNPAQIKAALNNGPVSIALAAGNNGFQSYRSGVYNGAGCGTQIDHAVVAVGWGNNGQDYFIIRNSWGGSWGEQGYIRLLSQNGVGTCGMNQYPAQVSTN